jgi:hypothetical protein
MSILQEELSSIVLAPRPGRANRSVSGSGVQMRRCMAAVESASTNEGGEAPEMKKKRQHRAQASIVPGTSVILGSPSLGVCEFGLPRVVGSAKGSGVA